MPHPEQNSGMGEVLPFPPHGDVFVGRDVPDKALRLSWHPGSNRLVLSLWRTDTCTGTVRLTVADASRLIASLAEGLAELAAGPSEQGRPATHP